MIPVDLRPDKTKVFHSGVYQEIGVKMTGNLINDAEIKLTKINES